MSSEPLTDIEQSMESTQLFFDGLGSAQALQLYMIGLENLEIELLNGYLELFTAEMDSETQIIALSAIPTLEDYLVLSETVSQADATYSVERWNRSVNYWALGYNSVADVPAGQNTDFIEPDVIGSMMETLENLELEAISRGYDDMTAMFEADHQYMTEYVEDNAGSVCASVSIKISQTITMTREAFEGTLTLFNGHATDSMQNISLDLLITNEQGFDCTDLFEISTEALNTVTAIDGTGELGADLEGSAVVLFIPENGAAPTYSVNYRFGGTLSYLDPFTNAMVEIDLFPVTLEVKPSPFIDLHYFLQRDVYGDDALTEDVVEPIVPAEMSILLHNK